MNKFIQKLMESDLSLTRALFFSLLAAGLPCRGAWAQITEEWVARYHEVDFDAAYALAVDGQGNVYVTGESAGSGTNNDYATVKYDSNGNPQWVVRYDMANLSDRAWSLAVDAQGNVYVAGDSEDFGPNNDYATLKYDTNGNLRWAARYNGPANSDDMARSLALDAQGNVHVTGGSIAGSDRDFATIKYDSNGNQLWVAPAFSYDSAYTLALDGQENVYVTRQSTGSGTNWDFATVKYDAGGIEQWVIRYDGPASNLDTVYPLLLRAERSGYADGRVYEITVQVADDSGNNSSQSVQVEVPHSKKDAGLESGQNYDATQIN